MVAVMDAVSWLQQDEDEEEDDDDYWSLSDKGLLSFYLLYSPGWLVSRFNGGLVCRHPTIEQQTNTSLLLL